MPPRKKYQTISIPQSGVLSIATSGMAASVPARAQREQRSETDRRRRADREQRVDDDLARRELGIYGQVVRPRLGEEQEERVEPAEEAVLIRPVELRVLEAPPLQGFHALPRLRHEVVTEPEGDRFRRARLGAGGPEAVVDAVVTERALLRRPRMLVQRDDAERAGRHAVAAPVADVLVDVDRAELRAVDRAGRTRVEAAGVRAVLADVGHEEPRHLALRPRLFDEA